MNVNILIPVYNDWDCLELLLKKIYNELKNELNFSVFVVNDCSTIDFPQEIFSRYNNLKLINLTRNIGHQKAIAVGLSFIAENEKSDTVIVMDADGEDRPEDLKLLIKTSESKSKIVFAKRKKRQTTIAFKIFYRLYRLSFFILVGKSISFGNYCAIPFQTLKKLVHVSEIWNHFSGGIVRSGLAYDSIPIDRGKRLVGVSRMNFVSLIVHGVTSYAVYLDVVVVRLLISFGLLILFSLFGTFAVIFMKFFTNLAIPGWATYTILGFCLIILQAFFIILNLAMNTLYYRSHKLVIPAIHYKDYISNVENE